MSEDKKTGEPFLARWSRRKRGEESERPASERMPSAVPNPSDAKTKPESDPATLPKIEDLLPDSDITAFLQKGVPEELKRLALRKAWSLDPSIRDFIEMAENQYDWNAPDGVPGFGALAEGTDIEALLAQATGKLRKLAEPESEPIATLPTESQSPNAASPSLNAPGPEIDSAALPPDNEPVPLSDIEAVRQSGADLADQQAAKATAEPPAASEQRVRRRHGGALPHNA